jgi:hypothetical protein
MTSTFELLESRRWQGHCLVDAVFNGGVAAVG